jgi:protein SCO1/2
MTRHTTRSTTRPARLLVAAAALAVLLASCGEDKSAKQLSGLQLTPPPAVANFAMPDVSNNKTAFHFAADAGHLLIVYFGYTQCPDVCPTTLNEVKIALSHIGAKASKVDVAMITVDPERDTGAILTSYVQSFVKGAHALRAEEDGGLARVAKGFGATYKVTKDAQGVESVTHSGNLYVVDHAGNVVLEWPFGLKADAIATDLEILLGTT